MKCKETRRRWSQQDRSSPYPAGQRHATKLEGIETAKRTLPSIALAAYMVKEHWRERDCQDHIELVVNQLTARLIIAHEEDSEWEFYGGDEKLWCLAFVIAEAWVIPAKYFLDGLQTQPKISVFAGEMGCDRKTWHTQWKSRFYEHGDILDTWYREGKYLSTGEAA